jgi:PhoH-like ATPase
LLTKTVVVDTNILISNPRVVEEYENHSIIIPYEVVQELDNLKTKKGKVGANARYFIKLLDEASKSSYLKNAKLNNNYVTVADPCGLEADDAVVKVAEDYSARVLSEDAAVRVKCSCRGIQASEPQAKRATPDIVCLEVGSECFDELMEEGETPLISNSLFCNQPVYVFCKGRGNRYIPSFFTKNKTLKKCWVTESTSIFGFSPINREQIFVTEALLNKSIELVIVRGKAGCGKTLLAMASGLYTCFDEGFYDKVLVVRPVQPLGKSLGFLPGSLEEKQRPWMEAAFDILGKVGNVGYLVDSGKLEFTTIEHVRGRTFDNSYIIVDEAQNMTYHQLKALLTRAGKGSKIVLTGDVEQSDLQESGLQGACEALTGDTLVASLELKTVERGSLARMVAEKM